MVSVLDWIAVLSTLASVAVAVIGFAGLLTAFQASSAPLNRQDIVNVRILLIFALGALVFSLLPLGFAQISGRSPWPLLTLLMAAFLLFWPLRSPFWNRNLAIRPRRPKLYWTILLLQALLAIALLVPALSGSAGASQYVVGILWCLLVAILTFVAQIFALLPVDRRD